MTRLYRKIHLTAMPRLLMALVAGVAAIGAGAADSASQSRLLLNIVVEGLDPDYIDILRQHFGDGGFRRLEREGVLLKNVDYGPGLDAAAATATLVSGAAPNVSGIAGATYYDRDRLRIADTYADDAQMGNFTSTAYTPAALRVSTISDEARIASGATNVVYAVAPDHALALALAGHAGNAALWMDPRTGNWASSTYYKEMPVAVATRNRTAPLAMRLDTMTWTPAMSPDAYPGLPDHMRRYPFRYVFPRANTARLDMFAASPLINREVTNVAADLLATLRVGQHEGVTDVLSVAYRLLPFDYGKNTDSRVEMLDAYVRLDADLARLLADIDRRVGAGNTTVMLAGTPPRPRSRRDDEQYGIPHGEFSTRKAISLLNIYLMAVYGNGDYVSGYHDGQLYLNHKLLKDKNLEAEEVRRQAAIFLAKMTGVDRVHTIDEIVAGHAGEHAESLRRNYPVSTSGDLLLTIAPGFEVVDDFTSPVPAGQIPMVERVAATTAPVFIMAPGIEPRTIGTPVDVRAIAPTVSRILRIRSPNGAGAPALHL